MSILDRRSKPCESSAAGLARCGPRGWTLLLGLGVLLATGAANAEEAKGRAPAAPQGKPASETAPALEPKAIALLKAASERLAGAGSMKFTAVVSYENPSLLGPPLVYTTKADVTLKRPDKLKVVQSGDGPVSEYYYDGKTLTAFSPAENLVAVAEAPPTIDAALKSAYDSAAIYFPFTDLIVADPYKDIAAELKQAFYIGQSKIVGGTTTDMVAYATDHTFVQIWIGAEDKLPRRVNAVFRDDPERLRHQMDLSGWQLGPAVAPDDFASAKAGAAKPIPFAHPGAKPAVANQPVAAEKPAGERSGGEP